MTVVYDDSTGLSSVISRASSEGARPAPVPQTLNAAPRVCTLPLPGLNVSLTRVVNLPRRLTYSVRVTNSIPLVLLLALERPLPVALSLPAPGA
jgi:hypothetical protein